MKTALSDRERLQRLHPDGEDDFPGAVAGAGGRAKEAEAPRALVVFFQTLKEPEEPNANGDVFIDQGGEKSLPVRPVRTRDKMNEELKQMYQRGKEALAKIKIKVLEETDNKLLEGVEDAEADEKLRRSLLL